MNNETITLWVINFLRWNYEDWHLCPNGHQGVYRLGITSDGERGYTQFRCPKCGAFTYVFCYHCCKPISNCTCGEK